MVRDYGTFIESSMNDAFINGIIELKYFRKYLYELLSELEALEHMNYHLPDQLPNANRVLKMEINKIWSKLEAHDRTRSADLAGTGEGRSMKRLKSAIVIPKRLIGKIIGPRGMIIQSLRLCSGCVIYIKQNGSMAGQEISDTPHRFQSIKNSGNSALVCIHSSDTNFLECEQKLEKALELVYERINHPETAQFRSAWRKLLTTVIDEL